VTQEATKNDFSSVPSSGMSSPGDPAAPCFQWLAERMGMAPLDPSAPPACESGNNSARSANIIYPQPVHPQKAKARKKKTTQRSIRMAKDNALGLSNVPPISSYCFSAFQDAPQHLHIPPRLQERPTTPGTDQ
jgi:hypothetical protein